MFNTTNLDAAEWEYIRSSFQDVADEDYIAARLLYRFGLLRSFRWSAHQAIEKYLKAILLFHGEDTRELGHDLEKALERVLALGILSITFPDDVKEFVKYLNHFGPDRYFEIPYYHTGEEFQLLDRTVWHIRRFCQKFSTVIRHKGRPPLNYGESLLNEAKRAKPSEAYRFRIFGGFLETVLENRRHELRPLLVWKNFYYGAKLRKRYRFAQRSASGNPMTFLFAGLYKRLKGRIRFSAGARQHFESKSDAPTARR